MLISFSDSTLLIPFIYFQFNWVCDRAYLSAVGQSAYYIGAVVGTITFGVIADRFGRMPAVMLTTLSGGFGDFLSSFTNNVTTYTISRFVSGLSTDTLFVLMYILGKLVILTKYL